MGGSIRRKAESECRWVWPCGLAVHSQDTADGSVSCVG